MTGGKKFRLITRTGNHWHRGCLLLLMTAFGLMGPPVFGDDTEIFISSDDTAISCEAPNVLFIIDTSASMASEVTTQIPFEPDTEFVGCYDSNVFYYATGDQTPECDSTAFFQKPSNQCLAAQGTQYFGDFQAWNEAQQRWTKLPESQPDWLLECAADEGIHGDGTQDQTYAVQGATGPWSANASARIAWGSNATSATLFDGNWLNWLSNPPEITQTRLEIVKDVTTQTLDILDDVNVALMNFNFSDGGSVIHAMEELATARDPMNDKIAALTAAGGSQPAEVLFEAGQYLAGRNVDYGDIQASNKSVAESRRGGAITSTTYRSPLNSDGQNNYIVLLTDGVANKDDSVNDKITSLPGYAQLVGTPCDDEGPDDTCLNNMAEYMFKADLRTGVPGQQNVITHTIGITVDEPLLASTAERGGGKYFVADDTANLARALGDLTKDFTRTASLFTSPIIPVNTFNRSERLDTVYVSMFEPANTAHWPGNLKRYATREADDGSSLLLVDANNRNAIDSNSGFFDVDAVSFWSAPLVDGAVVQSGGAASQLPDPGSRQIFTNINGDTLADPGNAVLVSNTDITAAMLGAPAEQRDDIIEWALGRDIRDSNQDGSTADARQAMGDPLHVQPVTVTYGADEATSDTVIFISTNDGYLHAIDAANGRELWAFIPERLLGRLYELSLDDPAANKQYGLDGEIRVVLQDNRKILLFGMRRGGEAVFAVDVTSKSSPKILWEIDSTQADFLDLGQTWSTPTVAEVNVGGSRRTVVIFAGGYDSGQDNRNFRTDQVGNAVYFVDLLDGSLIWSGGSGSAQNSHDLQLARMKFSIPAEMRVLDTNDDELVDRMYVGDMGGQLWRFDIINGNGSGSLVEGGVIASLGAADIAGDVPASEIRRFYNTPDVVRVVSDEKIFIAINLGSGYRAHPLDAGAVAADDEFFSIRDFNVFNTLDSSDYGLPLTRDQLPDIAPTNCPSTLGPADPGWRLGLVQGDGEKVLSPALTVANNLFFTSFTPLDQGNSCVPAGGLNRLYQVSVLDGCALTNRDQPIDESELTEIEPFIEVGIGAPVAPSFMPPGGCVGLGCFGDGQADDDSDDGPPQPPLGNRVKETYWFLNETP
jgi:type IV pilus assembly protein PilY1